MSKEMKYQFNRKIEVLDTGFCFGLLYYIISLGTHPVAYIKIPEDSKYFGKGISDIDIEVHGGITYEEDHLYISDSQKLEGYFIGWDYAHCYDYAGYEERLPITVRTNGKKWTTQEIYKEVRAACYKIQKAEQAMSKADEMFEAEGFKMLREDKESVLYVNDDIELPSRIEFDKKYLEIRVLTIDGLDDYPFDFTITTKLLQAINEKVKELKWI